MGRGLSTQQRQILGLAKAFNATQNDGVPTVPDFSYCLRDGDEFGERVALVDMAWHASLPDYHVGRELGVAQTSVRDAIGLSDSLAGKPIPASDESAATGLSTATIYRQRSLKADHPELWAEVEAGTKSTHAAAIAAIAAGPGSSFLSNAKRTFEVFPELFVVDNKNIYGGDVRVDSEISQKNHSR